MDTLLMLPYDKEDLDRVSDLVRKNESFVALVEGDLYSVHQYHLPSRLSNFTAILDRNVYTRVIAILRQSPISPAALDDHQWAAAVMAFCQIANITFQYGSSLQEYASSMGGEAAVADFKSFYEADNCETKAWIDYAVGRSSHLDISSIMNLAELKSVPESRQFETSIYEYRINYIFALKIIVLDFENSSPEQVMIRFLNWMKDDFVLGAGATHFANLLFSPGRIRGMLKKRNIKAAQNIAWDLAIFQHWRCCAIEGVKSSEPVLLITRDKVLKYLSKLIGASDWDEYRLQITEPWKRVPAKGELIFSHYCEVSQEVKATSDQRIRPSDTKLDALTCDLERELMRLNGD